MKKANAKVIVSDQTYLIGDKVRILVKNPDYSGKTATITIKGIYVFSNIVRLELKLKNMIGRVLWETTQVELLGANK